METLTDCFSDSVPNLYTYIKHDCHVLRAISFFLFGIFYIKTVLSWILDYNLSSHEISKHLNLFKLQVLNIYLYQVGQCNNTLYTPYDLLSVWWQKVRFTDLPPPTKSRAGTIFTAVTAGSQIFGRGRLMARVDFMPRMGVSSLVISKMDGAMGRACW